ncbi:16S rRNA (guanine(966)-N(2))-methyltransferase RsmD [Mycoplasma sp. CSL7491-lung]|uniref:16S rRNA (guanine(966)-N(2))-methyltransferase RsmD n=1 Tax=Mycoplasma sp. CSL7491-lung TaxID=549718 RepID=UPI0035BE138D
MLLYNKIKYTKISIYIIILIKEFYMLRIISGIYKNRLIQEPDLKITRPTTNKVREAIFSSIQFKIIDKNILDLFSGSGALSIEAVSRGASKAIAIEKNREVYKTLTSNINSLKIKNIRTLNIDANDFLNKNSDSFDFIFLDAPYNEYQLVNSVLEKIGEKSLLNSNGEIILETNKINEIIIPDKFRIFKQKRYGRIDILYICYENE